jgi:hypothetical protein
VSRLSTKQRRARARARPLRVFFDGEEWWVARDVEHARRLQQEAFDVPLYEIEHGQYWREEPLTKSIEWHDDEDGSSETIPFAELIRRSAPGLRPDGCGYLGGTDS